MPILYKASGGGSLKQSSNALPNGSQLDFVAGESIILAISVDNTGGATPGITSIEVPAGETNTWDLIRLHNPTNTSAGAAVRTFMYRLDSTVNGSFFPGVPFITLSASVTAKSFAWQRFSGLGALVTSVSGAGATNATMTGGFRNAGSIWLEVVGSEGPTAPVKNQGTAMTNIITYGTSGGSSATNANVSMSHIIGAWGFNSVQGYPVTDGQIIGAHFNAAPVPDLGSISNILAAHKARWDFSDSSGYALDGLGRVISAVDRSGTGATLNSEGFPMIENINGVPAVRFFGAQSLNGNGPAVLSQPYTVWAVVQMMSITPGASHAFVGHVRGVLKVEDNLYKAGTSSLELSRTSTPADLSPHIVIGYFDGPSSRIYVDSTIASFGGLENETLNINYLGRNGWGGEWADARIGESGIYPGELSLNDLNTLKDHLVTKWINVTPTSSDIQKIAIGNTLLPMDKLYVGSTKVNRVYIGDVMVYDDV